MLHQCLKFPPVIPKYSELLKTVQTSLQHFLLFNSQTIFLTEVIMIQELNHILLKVITKEQIMKPTNAKEIYATVCWGCDATQFSRDILIFEKKPLPPHLAKTILYPEHRGNEIHQTVFPTKLQALHSTRPKCSHSLQL